MTSSEHEIPRASDVRAFAEWSRDAFIQRPRVRVGGVEFIVTTLPEAVDEFVTIASGSKARGIPVRLSNAYCVALAADDPQYRAVLEGPGVTMPDGAPVGRLVRWKTRSAPVRGGRVRGPSFFVGVLDAGRRAGLRHFVLGASESTLDLLSTEIGRRFPGTVVAGTWSPPFGPLGEEFYAEAVRRVEAAKPDVVWLGLGTPKQDVAAVELAERLRLPVVGVGAAFDFFAGTVKEAPAFFRDHGLEWLYRLYAEPRRLWRRYVFGNLRFLAAVLTDEVGTRRSR